MDVSGEHQLLIAENIFKQRIRPDLTKIGNTLNSQSIKY